MKKIVKKISIVCITLFIFAACTDNVPVAEASFTIEKDTIIDAKKVRVQVTVADTINPVYFVYNGNATFNSVWPGDKFKTTVKINESLTVKNKNVTYFVSQNYDDKKDSVLLSYTMKKDTFFTQGAAVYQGIALPFGTKEIQYKFQSKGNLVVTWLSRNSNQGSNSESMSQKTISVK
ncbi:MAG: hypothetical protein WCJ61_02310 [Paludibacter sp.]